MSNTNQQQPEDDFGGTAVSRPTTTHAEWGAGDPHLIVTGDGLHRTFPLTADRVLIGSGEGCDVRLGDLKPAHAEIDHAEDDEYVLLVHGDVEEIGGAPTGEVSSQNDRQVLRTGAEFVLGPWRFVFMRAEFADHGRPYGGREGGEGTQQPHQPERPDYSDDPRRDGDGDGDGEGRPVDGARPTGPAEEARS